MNKLLILYILVSLNIRLDAQVVVVANTSLNILYVGVPNKLMVARPGFSCDEIKLICNAERVDGNGCEYFIIPQKPGEVSLLVETIQNNEIKQVDTVSFQAVYFSDPDLTVECGSYINGFHCNVGQIIVPFLKNFNFKIPFKVTGFNLKWYREDKLLKSQYIEGNMIPLDVEKDALENDKIVLEKIEVDAPDKKRILGPLTLIAKGKH